MGSIMQQVTFPLGRSVGPKTLQMSCSLRYKPDTKYRVKSSLPMATFAKLSQVFLVKSGGLEPVYENRCN
jgi:hypothetical protein